MENENRGYSSSNEPQRDLFAVAVDGEEGEGNVGSGGCPIEEADLREVAMGGIEARH